MSGTEKRNERRISLGSARVPCWRWCLTIANFSPAALTRKKACFGETPKPTPETRALPNPLNRAQTYDWRRNPEHESAEALLRARSRRGWFLHRSERLHRLQSLRSRV